MNWTYLDKEFRGNIRFFAFYTGNGTLAPPDADDLFDYEECLVQDSSMLRDLFLVYLNNWYQNSNTMLPEDRAAQWLLSICDPTYHIQPPLESWEHALPNPESIPGAIVDFVKALANGSLEPEVLGEIEYLPDLYEYGSTLEGVIAVFTNILQVSSDGRIHHIDHARYRAAQFLRHTLDETFEVVPPFEAWETELV